jgi:hypothetical protein
MQKIFLRVALGALVAIHVCPAAKAARIYGAGLVSCVEWQKYRTTPRDQPSSYQVEAWVDGFLSGWNQAEEREPDFLPSKIYSAAFYAWIDNYCGANPLDGVATAAFALRKELLARAKR